MNSSFPNRWSFSYLKFTKYVTNIISEPSVSVMAQNIQLFGPHEGFLTHQTGNADKYYDETEMRTRQKRVGDPWGVEQPTETLEQKKTIN